MSCLVPELRNKMHNRHRIQHVEKNALSLQLHCVYEPLVVLLKVEYLFK